MKIKVLHIVDIAGIGSILSHFHSKFDKGKSTIFYHKKNNFTLSISSYYGGTSFIKFRNLFFSSIIASRKYDIIHIHGIEHLVPIFKLLGKKVILHYHGSEIRNTQRSLDKKRIFSRSFADLIIYNDENLEEKIITFRNVKKRFLPNPIDTDLFSKKKGEKKGGFTYVSQSLDKIKTKEEVKKIMDVTLFEADKVQFLYKFAPTIFSKYKTYVDIRITSSGEELEPLSTTALQALSCGCEVYQMGKLIKELPDEHKPENVIEKLISYYREIIK